MINFILKKLKAFISVGNSIQVFKYYAIVYIAMYLKVPLNFFYMLMQLMKQSFYAKPLRILSAPTHVLYIITCTIFLLLRRLQQSPRSALNTIFVCKKGFDHHDTISNNNRPSFLHFRNPGSVALLLVAYFSEIIYPPHHWLQQGLWEKNLGVYVKKCAFRDMQQPTFL